METYWNSMTLLGPDLSPNSGLTFCGLGLKNKAKKGCQKCDPKMGFKLFPFDGQKWEAKKGLIIYGKK